MNSNCYYNSNVDGKQIKKIILLPLHIILSFLCCFLLGYCCFYVLFDLIISVKTVGDDINSNFKYFANDYLFNVFIGLRTNTTLFGEWWESLSSER